MDNRINGNLRKLAGHLQYDDGNLTIDPTGALRTITIYGIKYSVEFFRLFGEASIGKHFELIGRAGGIVTIAEIDLAHVAGDG
jgi:hypothetical protein